MCKLVCLTLLFLVGALLNAQGDLEATEKRLAQAKQIYSEILSPYCPGRLLSDCPSTSAAKLKQDILQKLNAGQTKQEIMDYLYGLYGANIRAVPGFAGFDLWAWLAPIFFLVVGLLLLVVWLLKNKSSEQDWQDQED